MEEKLKGTINLNEDLSLKERKKPKGYSRFLKNAIKCKEKVIKDII